MHPSFRIERLTPHEFAAINAIVEELLPQLTSGGGYTTESVTRAIVNPQNSVIVARTTLHPIPFRVAMLAVVNNLLGSTGIIHDVVVDRQYRKLGVGKALVDTLLQDARNLGLKSVDLTSHAERKEAIALYSKMGFVRVETNLMRVTL